MQANDIVLPVPKKDEYVSIFSICCLHIGHKCHDAQKALSYRDYILKTPDTYAWDLGDDIENAIPGDEVHNSMMWDSRMTPEEQYEAAKEFWKPLVEAGKLLITHDSNHWWRSEAKTGISIAREMNVFFNGVAKGVKKNAPKWGRWQSFSRVHIGKYVYKIHSWHGSGSSTTPSSVLNKCRSQAMTHHADVFLMGHFHRKMIDEDLYFDWPDGAGKPVQKKRVYGVTGSFLKWDDSYAERAGLSPGILGAIKVQLGATRWDVKISL